MDRFLIFLEFLINNLIIVSTITIAVILTFYLAHRAYKEFKINYKLRKFQQRLRNLSTKQKQKRAMLVSLRVFAPVFIVLLVLQVTMTSPINYESHMTQLKKSEDIEMIHSYYNQKFSTQVSLRSSAQSATTESDVLDTIQLTMGETLSETIKTDGEYIYYLHEQGLTVIVPENSNNPISSNITEPFENIIDFEPITIMIDDAQVIVIGNGRPNTMSIFDELDEEVDEINTYVLIFDKSSSLTFTESYAINGTYQDGHHYEENLYVITKHDVDFDGNPQYQLPSVEKNGFVSKITYSDMYYIEGTRPEVFTSILHIDMASNAISQKAMLSDLDTETLFVGNDVYFISESLLFYEATEMFTMSDPVAKVRTAVTRFSTLSSGIEYYKTRIIDGTFDGNMMVNENQTELMILTHNMSKSSYNLHTLSLDLNHVITSSELNFGGYSVKTLMKQENHLYFVTDESLQNFYVLNLANEDAELLHVSQSYNIPTTLAAFKDGLFIGIKYTNIATENGPVDGLRISLFDISNPYHLEERFYEEVHLSSFGFSLAETTKVNKPFILEIEHNQLILSITSNDEITSLINESVLVFNISTDSGFATSAVEYSTLTGEIGNSFFIILEGHLYFIVNDDVIVFEMNDTHAPVYQFKLE